MSDDLGMLLRTASYLAFEDGTNDYTTPALAATRIAELEAALQKIADRTRNAHLLSYAGHMELYQVSDFINDALAGGKDG